ncbi:monovalent cation/H+ antiporter complex subunit F [Rhodoligotrophos defluvii]|uniref:monovalent cation/H+ antiporter complex subunit F n=1 Tax=Rhodoligotrophos defluvii TaxID=2561934 RepID=UPI0010C98586|nr:cation:proton antiporter [Rhodoligotrophos defluvii]
MSVNIGGIVSLSLSIGFAALLLAFALIFIRLIRGPTLPDRVVALDLLTVVATAFILLLAIKNHAGAFVDVAISLGLVGFLSTVAFARYVMFRRLNPLGASRETQEEHTGPSDTVEGNQQS